MSKKSELSRDYKDIDIDLCDEFNDSWSERTFIHWAIDYYCLPLDDLRKISALILELCPEEGNNDIN